VTGGRERFEASRRGNFTGIYTPRPLRSAVHALPSPVNAAPRIPRTALALAPSPSFSLAVMPKKRQIFFHSNYRIKSLTYIWSIKCR
jgi:hypothetical protein